MAALSTIAHYRILSKLGEGGMGAVYRATDTKLNRDVAIKVLPEAFAQDAARMARFEREAQVLASLNHPNIAAIYGIEQGALIMELVEGPDLKGPVPVDTAIAYARQIALALEAAHEKGIVHRDLKPANIKITPAGVVKLLDFGLAKAGDDTPSAVTSASPTLSPTLSLEMTQAGMILGTAAYMSPEQARGQAVDKRADIWAFGVVLFELLTGSALFGRGETVTDSLAAVIMKEPDWKALPSDTPPRVRRLLEHCLRKDPKQRLRDIGDARLLLDEAEPAVAATLGPLPTSRLKWLPWALAAAALVTAGVAWLPKKSAGPGPVTARFAVALPEGVMLTGGPASTGAVPSPDGRNLALIVRGARGERSTIWVRALGSPAIHRLDNTEGATLPFWSANGQEVAFFTSDKLQAVTLSGGSARRICDLPATSGLDFPEGGTWNADNTIVFGTDHTPLLRVPATGGGKPTPVTVLDKDEVAHIWPQFLPDGRHLLYLARKTDRENDTIYVQELGSAQRVAVTKNVTRAMFSPPGHLLFVRDGTLFAQHMDAASFRVSGEPMAVEQDVIANETNGRSAFAISQNGVLAYRAGRNARTRQFAWYDRQGKRLSAVGDAQEFGRPALSPDGKSVAVVIGSVTKAGTWLMDLSTGVLTQLTHDGADSFLVAPAWSPDSQRLAIGQQGGGIREVVVASGKATTLANDKLVADAWTPDGRTLLCVSTDGTRLFRITPADGAKAQSVLVTQHRQGGYRISPDGRYVAYDSSEEGHSEVYVASLPSFAEKRKVSAHGGSHAAWVKGGKEIVYRGGNDDGYMMSAEITTSPTLAVGAPKSLFAWAAGSRIAYFAASVDGERFLILEPLQTGVNERSEYTVVVNWLADLK